MYKLFLCLQYLRRRRLALIAAAAVALCVAMVLIVVSVFDGFLKNVETAAKGLFGEIIVDAGDMSGIARYDEFIRFLRKQHPDQIEAATPVVYAYGILRINEGYTETVQVSGIRLPERLAVTSFGAGMFVQAGRKDASFDPPLADVMGRVKAHLAEIGRIQRREQARRLEERDPELLNRLRIADDNLLIESQMLEEAVERQRMIDELRRQQELEAARPDGQRNAARLEQIDRDIKRLGMDMDQIVRPPASRMILGLGIGGLSFRTAQAEVVRTVTAPHKAVLTLLPIARGFSTTITPNTRTFTVIDDARTGVSTIDSKSVYVPFETLQQLTDLGELKYEDGTVDPARCSQIQIKVRPEFAGDRRLVAVRKTVEAAWRAFVQEERELAWQEHQRRNPDAVKGDFLAGYRGPTRNPPMVQTWREKLDKFVGPIEKQRTLVTLMFGIISLVSVLLIFAIFYMIVMQKIRDIGIVRAVGGSSAGVAKIFLGFGAFTGLAGSVLGLTAGYLFVRYINEFEDAMAAWTGFRVWDREVWLFDRIPNNVDGSVMLVIALWAVASGLIGAIIPSVRAAMMEPVEAIRYE